MTRWDKRLLGLVVAAGAVSLALAGVAQAREANVVSVLTPEGSTSYSLDRPCRLSIDGLVGELVLQVENGEVSVVRSDCAQQRCVHAAAVSGEGGTIVCVPNGVIVRVTASEPEAVVDDVVR